MEPHERKESIHNAIRKHNKKSITRGELETLLGTAYSPELLQDLEEQKILMPFKGDPVRIDGFYGRYRINKDPLQKDFVDLIKKESLHYADPIHIMNYAWKNPDNWQRDKKYIDLVDTYLKAFGLPKEEILIQELGFLLVGDEKWIEKGPGKRILKNIELWDKLRVKERVLFPVFAIHQENYRKKENGSHKGLIVENKGTFRLLLKSLPQSAYTVLVYGSGWEIAGTMKYLPQFTGLPQVEYTYFGDLDPAGLSIWYHLYEGYGICPAKIYYENLIQVKPSIGKHTQKTQGKIRRIFEQESGILVGDMFAQHQYLPQEALSAESLREIFLSVE